MKRFTVAEAEALIPQLEKVFERVAELTASAELKAAAIRDRRDADPAADLIDRSQLQFLAARIDEEMRRIVALGAIPKGVDPALVDFPYRLDGRDVYLCWRLGEKKVSHWHGADEGFSGRKTLPKRKAA